MVQFFISQPGGAFGGKKVLEFVWRHLKRSLLEVQSFIILSLMDYQN